MPPLIGVVSVLALPIGNHLSPFSSPPTREHGDGVRQFMILNRKDVIAGLILATLARLCWAPRLKGPIDLRWDGAAYYILGTALAEGKGHRLLNEPGEIQSTLHPPMLPALIALHRWIAHTDDLVVLGHWLRLTYVVFFVSYVVAGYCMLRLFLSTSYAF